MTDYEQLVKALRSDAGNQYTSDAAAAIEALQAQLPKRGEWILKGTGGSMWTKMCSVCGAESWQSKIDKRPNYCENCGAKMEVQDADS